MDAKMAEHAKYVGRLCLDMYDTPFRKRAWRRVPHYVGCDGYFEWYFW